MSGDCPIRVAAGRRPADGPPADHQFNRSAGRMIRDATRVEQASRSAEPLGWPAVPPFRHWSIKR